MRGATGGDRDQGVLRHTYSVCPVCLRRIEARHVRREGGVFLEKECPHHGFFSAIFWRDTLSLSDWMGAVEPIGEGENRNCPHACGLCPDHRRTTCCTVLEVTGRCNLDCSFCFADRDGISEPSFSQVQGWLRELVRPGETLVQLSGGEPTLRDDLPQIVSEARQVGCKYVQLNSNGIRLAQDRPFVRELAEAGLSFVFLQFDGTEEAIYEKLRHRPLLEIKKQAIANCGEQNIGVVLVSTLVPGVNVDNIGETLRFGIAHSPFVRGVHFQPVSYFGKIPRRPRDEDRLTLDELIGQMKDQAGDILPWESLRPSCCDHPLCGFHGDYVVLDGGGLRSLGGRGTKERLCSPAVDPSAQNREFIARRWQRGDLGGAPLAAEGGDMEDMDYFLQRLRSRGFMVTAMAFQDVGNLDLERLRLCRLHVFEAGRTIPFCSRYLTAWDEE